ncbi:MAG: MaoC family dehydratase, partial [Acidimicrobiales bacterium]
MPHGPGGLWFEELTVGLVVDHAISRTVTETDNLLFTTLTHNPQPLHLDAEFASRSEFGQILVNSMYTVALAVGISVRETTLGTTVANLGFGEIVFPKPVFLGDTLRVQTEVMATRESKSRPGAGLVTFEHRATNQRDELVCRAQRTALMKRRPVAVPGEVPTVQLRKP